MNYKLPRYASKQAFTIFGVFLLIYCRSVIAAPTEITCTPEEIREFTARIHVRCLEQFPDASGVASINYFATPVSSVALAQQLRSLGSAAMSDGRLMLTYDPNDASGASFGCQSNDCRPISSMRLVVPGPYVMKFNIQGEPRSALIYPSIDQGPFASPAPVGFYFHGHTGTMYDSAGRRRFHSLWPQAIIVYAQGSWVDHNGLSDPPGDDIANDNVWPGWQIRFPYKYLAPVDFTKDIDYVREVIARLKREHLIDRTRMIASGHSGGSFFTLALAELMPNVFSGFAVLGAYSRYKVDLNPALDPWENGAARRVALQPGIDRTRHPRPILYAFGMSDTAFDRDGPDAIPGWNSSPGIQTRALQTLQDLTIRNGCNSAAPGYTPSAAQTFSGADPGDSKIHWWPYTGTHSFPEQANNVFIQFFKNRSQHPVTGAPVVNCD